MISKNKVKQIKSLAQKKFRQKEQLFLVEGDKNVLEVLNSGIRVERTLCHRKFFSLHINKVSKKGRKNLVRKASSAEIKKASLLKHHSELPCNLHFAAAG
jgi:RNA methyltransferase, TrmH family